MISMILHKNSVVSSFFKEFRRADGEHRSRLSDYEQVHNDREDARRKLEQLRQQRFQGQLWGQFLHFFYRKVLTNNKDIKEQQYQQ